MVTSKDIIQNFGDVEVVAFIRRSVNISRPRPS